MNSFSRPNLLISLNNTIWTVLVGLISWLVWIIPYEHFFTSVDCLFQCLNRNPSDFRWCSRNGSCWRCFLRHLPQVSPSLSACLYFSVCISLSVCLSLPVCLSLCLCLCLQYVSVSSSLSVSLKPLFLIGRIVRSPNILRTVRRTMLRSQLAYNEKQASARTCGRSAADSMIQNVG